MPNHSPDPRADGTIGTADAADAAAEPWWRQAVVYQVYPRSFADSDGDGLGDLPGITSRVDYLAELGTDAVWLSPFYPSELVDGGYDVANYRDVDPRLGTLADFDELVAKLRIHGIRIVIDIVPNHTSDQHAWFQEALITGRASPARQRYHFREGRGLDGAEPPTDWVSEFGGPAWTRVSDGQWYLHSFAPEQPDLNWGCDEVREDFLKTLRFWSDRGVDGFRIDVAHMLTKDLSEPLPSLAEVLARPRGGNHPLYDRDDVHEVYAQWRSVFNEYDPPRAAVAEAWVDRSRIPLYASPDGLGQAFNFDLLLADFDAGQFRAIVSDNLDLAASSGSSSTWVLSNHDVVRHATRYGLPPRHQGGESFHIPSPGEESTAAPSPSVEWLRSGGRNPQLDRDTGLRRARAASMFILGLPGSTYLYQGEELGLHEVATIAAEDRQDPTFFRSQGAEPGRDGCRVPIPWTSTGPSLGFGGGGAYIPQPAWFADSAADVQDSDPTSTLSLYRHALRLRATLRSDEALTWADAARADVLRYRRSNGWEVVTNFGTEPYPLDHGVVVLATTPGPPGVVPAESTVWTVPSPAGEGTDGL